MTYKSKRDKIRADLRRQATSFQKHDANTSQVKDNSKISQVSNNHFKKDLQKSLLLSISLIALELIIYFASIKK